MTAAGFGEQVQASGAVARNGALAPAAAGARLVQTAVAGHALGAAVARRPFAKGRQSQACSRRDLPTMEAALGRAHRLPTSGAGEVRELLRF